MDQNDFLPKIPDNKKSQDHKGHIYQSSDGNGCDKVSY